MDVGASILLIVKCELGLIFMTNVAIFLSIAAQCYTAIT